MAFIQILMAAGIPCLFIGVFLLLFQRSLKKRDAKEEVKRLEIKQEIAERKRHEAEEHKRHEDAQKQYFLSQLQMNYAAISLATQTALSVQRRDRKCNGEMTKALAYANEVKNTSRKLLQQLGIENLHF